MKLPQLVLVVIAALMLSSCASPEARRTRGGGPGADVGNRDKEVEMHEGSHPYWQTPQVISVAHPPLEPARQAAQRDQQ